MVTNVYNGLWTNWEDGRVKGVTLTLPTYYGLVLVSFLTLYVQYSGVCFWRVLCFILHQFRSTTTSRDGLFHQQQTILRNAITAPNAMWSLTRSAMVWRGKVDSPILHSLPLMITTIIHIAFFAVAGLFCSQVTDTTVGQALVRSGTCGFTAEIPNPRTVNSQELSNEALFVFSTEVLLGRLTLTKSAAYVRSCYNDTTNGRTSACNLYIKPHLVGVNASSVNNASCPFGDDACATQAVRYDSGYIHSSEDLGINTPDEDSLTMRRVTTCAPINADKYATGWRDNLPEAHVGLSNTSVKFIEFGRGKGDILAGCDATTGTTTTKDTTFCVSQYMKDNFQAAYTLRSNTVYHSNYNASDFDPLPAFNPASSDTTLISIFNRAAYAGSSNDPLFNAQNQSSQNPQFYTATHDLSVLGCTEQYQLCIPNSDDSEKAPSACTPLTGLYGIKEEVEEKGTLNLAPGSRNRAVYTVLWKSAWAMSMQWAVEVLGSDVLLAWDWVFTSSSTGSSSLPDYQWQLESYNLHNLSLAVFQRRVNEYSAPESFDISPTMNSLDQVIPPTDPEMQRLCRQQKVLSTDHYSVSILGMAIILTVGGVLILLDWVLVQQIFWFRRVVTHQRIAKKADWTTSGTLQLFRQALEARGVGPWNEDDYEFPVLMGSEGSERRFGALATHGAGNGLVSPIVMGAGGQGGWYRRTMTGYQGAGGGWSGSGGDGGMYEMVPQPSEGTSFGDEKKSRSRAGS